MAEAGLYLARLLHILSTVLVFGGLAYALYAPGPSVAGRQHPLLLLATAVALITGILWFVFGTAVMAGSALLPDAETMQFVLWGTDFGRLWIGRMVLATVLIVLLVPSKGHVLGTGRLLVALVLLATLAGTGHTQMRDGPLRIIHMVSDGVHLLAAGLWLGGLVPLLVALRNRATSVEVNIALLHRFSLLGYGAVAALLATGTLNSWFILESPDQLITTTYGRLLLLKILFFGLMLALAAANRFMLVPALERTIQAPVKATAWSRRLQQHVMLEQGLGFLILAIVAHLGTSAP